MGNRMSTIHENPENSRNDLATIPSSQWRSVLLKKCKPVREGNSNISEWLVNYYKGNPIKWQKSTAYPEITILINRNTENIFLLYRINLFKEGNGEMFTYYFIRATHLLSEITQQRHVKFRTCILKYYFLLIEHYQINKIQIWWLLIQIFHPTIDDRFHFQYH